MLSSLHNKYYDLLIWLGAAPPEEAKPVPAGCTENNELESAPIPDCAEETNPWKKYLCQALPDETQAVDRNAAITRQYACWYLQQPLLFKWAGMAAFASHRVGFFLMDMENQNPDVELMRQTNNQVFADVGWAHLAYMKEGLSAVEAGIAGQPNYDLMLKGFRLIDEGRVALMEAGIAPDGTNKPAKTMPQEAYNLIWQGNLLLLKQEQSVTVQRSFTEFSYSFKQSLDSLAWATTLDFDANNLYTDSQTRASFEEYQRVSRVALDFTKFEDRWAWTVSEALPKWQAVEATNAADTLRAIVHHGDRSRWIKLFNWLKRRMSRTVTGEIELFINLAAMLGLIQRLTEMLKEALTDVLVRWVLLPPRSDSKQNHLLENATNDD